jgi:photosynthetic reaction center cytochrome c subunit
MRATIFSKRKALAMGACGLAMVVVAGCEAPSMESVQRGYRGVGQNIYVNPRILNDQLRANVPPAPVPAAVPVPTTAGSVYKNLQVLGNVPITEFTRQMLAISEWVVPKDQWVNGQGCIYCHDLNDMAADTKYTKVVARNMIKMTLRTNSAWKEHVSPTGVTCYTCHRGNAVPKYVWTTNPGLKAASGIVSTGQNRLSPVPAFAALPYDPMTTYFDKDTNIAVTPPKAIAPAFKKTVGIKQSEWTYSLMMYISRSLGVGCNHCHNSRQFADWKQSQPARVKAWFGIRQVRELNANYIWPLKDILPASRKGPLGDPKRIGCDTCHQGVYKPLFGAPMLKDYPALQAPVPAAAPAAPAQPAVKTSAEGTNAAPAKVTGQPGKADAVM